jgi:hypothetical protein
MFALAASEPVPLVIDRNVKSKDLTPMIQVFFDASMWRTLRCMELGHVKYLLLDRASEQRWQNARQGWRRFTQIMQPIVTDSYYSVYLKK